MGEYFGTDGIRGVAGDLLTPEFAVQVGRAAAVVLAQKTGPHPLFVIGRDTRLSGPMLEAALTAGLTSGGARVEVAGVIPTPGLASSSSRAPASS
jgi:phosphoglucosamine mutase